MATPSKMAVWGNYRAYLLVERGCARSTISTWRLILMDFWAFAERRKGDRRDPHGIHADPQLERAS